jgi:hypothetical protein
VTERRPPDDPGNELDEDENPEFDRFEELTKKLLGVEKPEAESDEKMKARPETPPK